MRLQLILLMTVATLLFIANALAIAEERRSLRLAKLSDEERNNPLSYLLSKATKIIPIDWKLSWWQNISGTSADEVMEKLGLSGLTGKALTDHGNYPKLLKYMDKAEKDALWEKANVQYSIFKMWHDVELNQMTTVREGMTLKDILAQLKQVEGTEAFRVYKRYAILYDDLILARMKSGYNRPSKFRDKEAYELEKYARVQFWAEKGRTDTFVKEVLGLKVANAEKLKENPYYQYFLKLVMEKKVD